MNASKARIAGDEEKLSFDDKVALYGLAMQAEQGDAPAWGENCAPPGCSSRIEELHFRAWHELRGTSKADARKLYVDRVKSLL